jgi:uncharacterized secreted protein with C-terminal beta-propeller domain
MENREREMLEKVKNMAEDIQVPESLRPDAVEESIKEAGAKKTKRKWRRGYTLGLAAACCLLVCGAAYGVWNIQNKGASKDSYSAEMKNSNGKIRTAESYEEVYAYAKQYIDDQDIIMVEDAVAYDSAEMATEESADTYSGTSAGANARSESSDYSETNVRQEGVDEADIVKTDGRYLYTLTGNNNKITIVDTQSGLERVGEIRTEEEKYICEFYVRDQKVVVVLGNNYTYYSEETDSFCYDRYGSTTVRTYDVQDKAQPEQVGEVTQSGSYTSSRIADGYLYLFSQYFLYSDIDENVPATYIPVVEARTLPEDDIYLPEENMANMYEVVTAIDLSKPDEVTDSKAIFAKYGDLYVSNDNIYWYESTWGMDETTSIRKISYKDGMLEAVAKGSIPGYIQDSFCIDEYDGYLRIVTTNGDTNGVYVLNGNMELVGSVEGLAEGERIYSARFLGDTGYFVTFRETDPLFSVDLSDPMNPQIVGELKIPGFSEYLHFYGEDKLLGIGRSIDEETGVDEGVKISIFDISDRTNVKENNVYVMKNVYDTDVFYDYKAVVISAEKNLIGFSGYTEGGEIYYVFSYDEENGFACEMEEEVNGTGYLGTRGIYIGDVLYIVKGNIIEAYDLNSYNKVDDIIV